MSTIEDRPGEEEEVRRKLRRICMENYFRPIPQNTLEGSQEHSAWLGHFWDSEKIWFCRRELDLTSERRVIFQIDNINNGANQRTVVQKKSEKYLFENQIQYDSTKICTKSAKKCS